MHPLAAATLAQADSQGRALALRTNEQISYENALCNKRDLHGLSWDFTCKATEGFIKGLRVQGQKVECTSMKVTSEPSAVYTSENSRPM